MQASVEPGAYYEEIVRAVPAVIDGRRNWTGVAEQSASGEARFPAKNGGIVFDHTAHAKREKNDCKTCHSSLFAQDSKAPLAFKPPHKNAEDKKTACGACHRTGGTAFETKANCTNGKCHIKPGTKKG